MLWIENGIIKYQGISLLENINFEIKNTEKIAIVGRNGSGKTSLLKLIAGEIDLSKRTSDYQIKMKKNHGIKIGYMKQIAFEDNTLSLLDELMKVYTPIIELQKELDILIEKMNYDSSDKIILEYTNLQETFMSLGGYECNQDYEKILYKLGFNKRDLSKRLNEFSGGEQTRIALAKMILSKPDIMLLDEPTNYLDVEMIEWLENYIQHYEKAVVIVSHDRMFLDRVTNIVYEIEHKTIYRYVGNYSAYLIQKEKNWEKLNKEYEEQEKEIKRLKETAERFKHIPSKAAMAKGRLKYIERICKISKPVKPNMKTFQIDLQPERRSFQEVIRLESLKIGYEQLVAEVTCLIERGKRVAILGKNGTGKSVLLKTLMGEVAPIEGIISWGMNSDVGYYNQDCINYISQNTVIDEFWTCFPKLTQNEVRSFLGMFLFSGDAVYKKIEQLSGGEKARLQLAKIMRKKPNVLILDEPTNHMDLLGREALENILKEYIGTIICVTHDRYFASKISDSLLIFQNNTVVYTPLSYDEYFQSVK